MTALPLVASIFLVVVLFLARSAQKAPGNAATASTAAIASPAISAESDLIGETLFRMERRFPRDSAPQMPGGWISIGLADRYNR